jgi:hypothetical protein
MYRVRDNAFAAHGQAFAALLQALGFACSLHTAACVALFVIPRPVRPSVAHGLRTSRHPADYGISV